MDMNVVDKRRIKAISNPLRSIFAVLSVLLFLFIAAVTMAVGEVVIPLVSLGFAIIFMVVFILSFSVVAVSSEGVSQRGLFGPWRCIGWDDIRQVGVIGTKAFPRSELNKGGRKYIYFSTKKLDEDELFKIILNWPVRNLMHIPYNDARFKSVSYLWGKDIDRYNTGDPFLH